MRFEVETRTEWGEVRRSYPYPSPLHPPPIVLTDNSPPTLRRYRHQSIHIAGSSPSLGSWSDSSALTLSSANYTAANPIWSTEEAVKVEGRMGVEWKVRFLDTVLLLPSPPGRWRGLR